MKRYTLLLLLSASFGLPQFAYAQLGELQPLKPDFNQVTVSDEAIFSEDAPVMLTANQIDYDQQKDVVN